MRCYQTIDGVAVNWAGWTARATIAQGSKKLITLTTDSGGGITLSSSGAVLTLTAAQTLAMPVGPAVTDLRLVSPDTTVSYTAQIPLYVTATTTKAT